MAEGTELLISIDATGAIQGARSFKRSATDIQKSAGKATVATQGMTKSMVGAGKAATMLKRILPGIGGALVLTSAIRQIGDFHPIFFKISTDFQNGRMLDPAGDNVIAFIPIGIRNTYDGMIVGLGTAAGKGDFFRTAME